MDMVKPRPRRGRCIFVPIQLVLTLCRNWPESWKRMYYKWALKVMYSALLREWREFRHPDLFTSLGYDITWLCFNIWQCKLFLTSCLFVCVCVMCVYMLLCVAVMGVSKRTFLHNLVRCDWSSSKLLAMFYYKNLLVNLTTMWFIQVAYVATYLM